MDPPDRTNVAVIAGDAAERAAAVAILRRTGFDAEALGSPESGRRSRDGSAWPPEEDLRIPRNADAVVVLTRGSGLEPGVAAARVRSVAGDRGVVVGVSGSAEISAPLAGAFGCGAVLLRWPAAPHDLARAVESAVTSARGARRLAGAGAPPGTSAAIETALALAGPEGHPGWFLDALVPALGLDGGGGAVLLPRLSGPPRVLAAHGITEAHVVRMAKRHPPEEPLGRSPARVRLGRGLRSPSSRLRAVRGWWWLPGPSCGGLGSLALIVHGRLREESAWLDEAIDLVAERLAHRHAAPPFDPVTGFERTDVEALASKLPAVFAASGGVRGACVLRVSLGGLPDLRRDYGPRAEGRFLAAAARVLAACLRPRDLVLSAGRDEFAVVVAARDPGHAERIRSRLQDALAGRVVLRRETDGLRDGAPLRASVRALFVPADESPARTVEALRRLGIRPASPSGDDATDSPAGRFR